MTVQRCKYRHVLYVAGTSKIHYLLCPKSRYTLDHLGRGVSLNWHFTAQLANQSLEVQRQLPSMASRSVRQSGAFLL